MQDNSLELNQREFKHLRNIGIVRYLKEKGAKVRYLSERSTRCIDKYDVEMPNGIRGYLVNGYAGFWTVTVDGRRYQTYSVVPTLVVLNGETVRPEHLTPATRDIYEEIRQRNGKPARPRDVGSARCVLEQLRSMGLLKKVGKFRYVASCESRILEDDIHRKENTTTYGDRLIMDLESGIIYDDMTGIEWNIGPDEDITHHEADEWVDRLANDWNLPTVWDLAELLPELAKYWSLTNWHSSTTPESEIRIWTQEISPEDPTLATSVCVYNGDCYKRDCDRAKSEDMRAMAVRKGS